MKDEEARRLIAFREEREAAERARYTGPDGEYVEQPPSEEALRDLVGRANNEHGSWVRPSPSGYWLDLVAMGRELLTLRARVAELEAELAQARQSNTMACESPCGTCAGCLYAADVHEGSGVRHG